jgi:hypothetical protein
VIKIFQTTIIHYPGNMYLNVSVQNLMYIGASLVLARFVILTGPSVGKIFGGGGWTWVLWQECKDDSMYRRDWSWIVGVLGTVDASA